MTPASETPNHGKIGTRSTVGGETGQKPIQASHGLMKAGSVQRNGATMTGTATRATTQSGARRKGSAMSEKSAMAWSTPNEAKYSPKAM